MVFPGVERWAGSREVIVNGFWLHRGSGCEWGEET